MPATLVSSRVRASDDLVQVASKVLLQLSALSISLQSDGGELLGFLSVHIAVKCRKKDVTGTCISAES